MSQSRQAVLIMIFFFVMIATVVLWLKDAADGNDWRNRWIATGLTVAVLTMLLRAEFRKDSVPDLLKEEHGQYYERDGFCFRIGIVAIEGESVLQVHFQNRFAGRCEAMVQIQPLRLRVKKPPMPIVNIPVDCPGGAYGNCSMVWPIPQEWQGKTCLIGIAAAARYPDGRGTLLRSRSGAAVGKLSKGIWGTGMSLLQLAALGPLHAIMNAQPTRQKKLLPEGVAWTGPESQAVVSEILWLPGPAQDA